VASAKRGRPAKQLGHRVWFTRNESGTFTARQRVPNSGGRYIQATGDTREQAEIALKAKLDKAAELATLRQEHRADAIRPDQTLGEAASIWLRRRRLDPSITDQTKDFYARVVKQTIIDRKIGAEPLSAVTPGRLFQHYTDIAWGNLDLSPAARRRSGTKNGPAPAQAKNFKKTVRLVLAQAVLDGAMKLNPAKELPRDSNTRKGNKPEAPTIEDVNALRDAINVWRDRSKGRPGAPRDPSFVTSDVLEVLIGTGLRIGEALALRPADLDLDDGIPRLRVTGTLVTRVGHGLGRQDHPKSDESDRELAIPPFAVDALRRQLELNRCEHLVFATAKGTPVSPNNIRRNMRAAINEAHIGRVTSHALRRLVATMLAESSEGETGAQRQLGHTDVRITKRHYIARKRRLVDNSAVLDVHLSPRSENATGSDSERGNR